MTAIYAFGPFRLDVAAGILFRGAEPVALGQRAIALLQILVEGGGNPISKDRLIESAWPGLAIEESNLPVQIAALRRVFAEEPGGDSWIETLPRRGYRYVGPVAVKEQENQGAAGNEHPALAPPAMQAAEQDIRKKMLAQTISDQPRKPPKPPTNSSPTQSPVRPPPPVVQPPSQ